MKLSDVAKKMIFILGIAFLILLAAGFTGSFFISALEFLPFALGALLGALLNVFKVWMLDRTVKKVVGMEAAKAGNYVRMQQLLRFVLTGLVLVAAALIPFISIWGAAVGVLTFQIALPFMKRGIKNGDATA